MSYIEDEVMVVVVVVVMAESDMPVSDIAMPVSAGASTEVVVSVVVDVSVDFWQAAAARHMATAAASGSILEFILIIGLSFSPGGFGHARRVSTLG